MESLELRVMLDPAWVEETRQRGDLEAIIELRRNGRILAQSLPKDVFRDMVWVAKGLRIPTLGDILYSVHDATTGEILASLVAPAFRQARRIIGGVENRRQLDVRGWVLDPGCPERRRKVALHVDGRLLKVITADGKRADIAHQKGTDGNHGFLWRIPEGTPINEGTRIEVFDADTGRPLRGSPLRVNSGQVVTCTAHGR